jgi:hypothetical protein
MGIKIIKMGGGGQWVSLLALLKKSRRVPPSSAPRWTFVIPEHSQRAAINVRREGKDTLARNPTSSFFCFSLSIDIFAACG